MMMMMKTLLVAKITVVYDETVVGRIEMSEWRLRM